MSNSPHPLCSICHEHHALSAGHIWPKVVAAEVPVAAPPPVYPERPLGVMSVVTDAPAKFDRTAYQRRYMADRPKAKAEGLTVKQWREKHGVAP